MLGLCCFKCPRYTVHQTFSFPERKTPGLIGMMYCTTISYIGEFGLRIFYHHVRYGPSSSDGVGGLFLVLFISD